MITPAATLLIWGLIGGIGYAGTRLSTALWGNQEIEPNARALAIAQFVLAIILAPSAAMTLTPWLVILFPNAPQQPIAFIVGLSFNSIWPIMTERGFVRKLIADFMRGFANRLTPGAD